MTPSKHSSLSSLRSVKHPRLTQDASSLNQPADEISPETLQAEIQEAADMLDDLQLQVEPSRLAEIESAARKIVTGLGFTEELLASPQKGSSRVWRGVLR